MIFYNGISKERVLEAYKYALKLKSKNKKLGQRSIQRKIKEELGLELIEGTISGWIYRKVVPFAQEKTQFKPKPIPRRMELYKGYVKENISAQRLAKKYKVSTIILINWLHHYKLPVRSHKQSMNTSLIKNELRELKLRRPIKEYHKLSPEKAYILGVICGDGFIRENLVKLEIRNDKEFIEKFVHYIEKVYGIKYYYRHYKPRDSYIVDISSQIIAQDLLRYGKFRTFTWYVPKEILNSSRKDIIINFLKGFYDSEGNIASYYVNLTTASKRGSEGILVLLKKLGISAKQYTERKYFKIIISRKKNLKKFKDLINFTIERKKERLENPYRLGW